MAKIKQLEQLDKSMITPIKDYIDDFRKNIVFGVESIKRAAESYVAALHAHPNTAHDEFSKSFPTITDDTWSRLRKIGNGDANPHILLCRESFAEKVSRLPIRHQNSLFGSSGFLKVYDMRVGKVKDVAFGDITASQERMIFDDSTGRVRSIQEQKAYADELARQEKQKERKLPYRAVGNTLIVSGRCEISLSEILRMFKVQG